MPARPETQYEKHHKIDIGLSDEQRLGSARVLNRVVADLHVIYIKTRKYHWNITGPQFWAVHAMLEAQYNQLADEIDEIAERVRMVGGHAIGTMSEFMEQTRLAEQPGEYPNARDMLHDLLHDHEQMVRNLRQDVETVQQEFEDVTTADALTGLARLHEKIAWMLGSMVADDHSLNEQTGGDGANGRKR
jgi:starvation-inducible DNA-binding protein